MPHDIGFVTAQDGKPAHYQMLQKIKDLALRSGDWQLLREDISTDNHEIILKGRGYSQKEEIFVGVRTYQNPQADYYNLAVATFTGYVPSNPFDNQPSAKISGVPAHNQRIDYWLTVNPQRIACCMKVGTPVYEHFYIGKFLPYARPSQYPYPVVCAGMLNGTPTTRFSDTSQKATAEILPCGLIQACIHSLSATPTIHQHWRAVGKLGTPMAFIHSCRLF
ncbi:Uncharacterised protein [Moraxella caprae]|uniref:Uncharacterized protein n=1 Tax=Moraxella caprae TaxID=90240 RepID=A0A378R015_9GAMM|nr:hypothetical protein [Moraxella caprae]STZ08602.1 Uncharacterised protein [Moraxella caprae]